MTLCDTCSLPVEHHTLWCPANAKVNGKGLEAARRYARWHLGEWEWADWIIDAYLNPEEAHRVLDQEEEED